MLVIDRMRAALGESWIPDYEKRDPDEVPLTTAELAECTCPEFCERDHDND
jgi:hypothetical protein